MTTMGIPGPAPVDEAAAAYYDVADLRRRLATICELAERAEADWAAVAEPLRKRVAKDTWIAGTSRVYGNAKANELAGTIADLATALAGVREKAANVRAVAAAIERATGR